ncbi:hypothetical protein KTT_51300 [Tengunoibacter tsumagoiensis]|uniref:N-acetyltransferase domain-containing protein n=2 Tax=Tengunoibacter tsumagoiensis TaxID=2014871 RepID=A0A402A8I5_9CHLR|nr:hypothetical protein KTT_51300 [Tengunoibacter tsumagoiensis]
MLSLCPGNPYGAYTRSFGKAVALLAQKAHSGLYNRVHHISGDDVGFLDEIIEWYRSSGGICSFQVVPLLSSPSLLWQLAKHGFYQSGFYNVLYGLPAIQQASFPQLTIRSVEPEEKETFVDIYFNSFGLPKTAAYGYVHESMSRLIDVSSNNCFFALVDKKPVAIAILSLYQQVGYLALAATLPSFRAYGCHQALLQARITRAISQECELIVGQAGVATGSQRNMERSGLRLAYTKTDWTIYNALADPDKNTTSFNR